MKVATTFRTTTGTIWRVAGTQMVRVQRADAGPGQDPGAEAMAYEAVPNAVGRDGVPIIAVRVNGTVTFIDRGRPCTTGRVAEILRVASIHDPSGSGVAATSSSSAA